MKSFALVLALAFLWGASYPLLKASMETIPPLTVVALRSLLGGLVLLAALGARAYQVREMGLRELAIQSAFNCILPWILVAWAVMRIDAGLVTILNSLSPIFIFLITALVTRHEPVTRLKFAGVVLGLGGVATIVGLDALAGIGTKTAAELACVAGAFCYAIAGVRGVRFARLSPLVPAAGTTLLSTGLAMVIYFRLLATVGSIAMSSQAYLRILVGVGLGVAVLGEELAASTVAGLALVVAGVVAMTLPGRYHRRNGTQREQR